MHGQPHWLWRAVDHEGYILDEILQTRRNTKAAKASADQTSENGRGPPQAHGHRQTGLLWRGQTESEAAGPAFFPQGIKQVGGERSPAIMKARAGDAEISLPRRLPAFRLRLLRSSQHLRPARFQQQSPGPA
ncbi:DDE-type integrase/transposase/recombinase [Acetobacter senegalensis]|uniref:DDE-type integrase/transposase/recombinase n=1 Tax=Acetobacter senegalensis TaxID=446692 RepID=UPI0038CFCF0D